MSDRHVRKTVFPGIADFRKGLAPKAVVHEKTLLNPNSPSRRIFSSLELLLDGAVFEPGDTVGVQAINHPREVGRLLDALKVDPSQKISINGKEYALGEYLEKEAEIVRADVIMVKTINDKIKKGEVKGSNVHLIDRAVEDWIKAEERKAPKDDPLRTAMNELASSSIADLIEHFDLQGLKIEDLKKLRLREYTMSGARSMNPDKVHITYALVKYPVPFNTELQKYGVCTEYMENLKPGDEVAIVMFSKPHFHLPGKEQAEDTSIIMIGAGTGIAPGRAFKEDIQYRKAHGEKFRDVVLYSGGQYNPDALYREDMTKAHQEGVLTAPPSYAISRATDKKVYIQDHLSRDAEALRRMTADGKGLVYICGDKVAGNQIIETLKAIAPTLQDRQIKTDLY